MSKTNISKVIEALINPEGNKVIPGVIKTGCSYGITVWDSFGRNISKSQLDRILNNSNQEQEPQKDKYINISYYSCTHHDRGEGIFAHELGHALSHIVVNGELSKESLKKYKKLRNCATTQKGSDEVPLIDEIMGDKLYTEEDTADLISYILTPKDLIYSCSLLLHSNLEEYSNLKIENPDKNDNHSTSLSRVIMEAVNKGLEIPQSCKKGIKNSNTKIRFEKCI